MLQEVENETKIQSFKEITVQRRHIRDYSVRAVLFSVIPNYSTLHNISNIARQSAVLCFISMCSCLAILTNQTDLSCGDISSFAACVAAKAMNGGCSVLVGCLIGLLAALAIGAINGVLAG